MSVYALLGGNADDVAAQVDCAAAITKQLKSTLTGLLIMPDPANAAVYVAGPDMVMAGGAGVAAIQKAQEAAKDTLSKAFEDACKAQGNWLKYSFETETADVALRAAGAAMLSRALVVPRASVDTAHALNSAFEHVLMETHLPLVVASETPQPMDTCIIAWDGSSQAARAVRMHQDLVLSFKQVVIAHNPEKVRNSAAASGVSDPQALADFLHEKGASTEIVELGNDISDSLLSAARDHKAGLVVMGAYGHSRLGEMLFGGTSKAMLRADDGPALALTH